jgi:hypothetical protein
MKNSIAIFFISLFLASCSNSTTTNAPPNTNVSTPTTTTHKSDNEIPSSVRAAFPDAQTITKERKQISSSQIAAIEKETGEKVSDTDHYSYLAFKTEDGTRKQIGAATVVKADGKDVIVIYGSHEAVPKSKRFALKALRKHSWTSSKAKAITTNCILANQSKLKVLMKE